MIWVRESNNKFSYQLRAPCEHFKLPPPASTSTAPATNFLSGDHINLPLLDITPCTLHPLSHCSKCYILCIILLPVTHFPLPVFLYFSIFSCIFVLLLTHPTLPWYFDFLYFVFSYYFLLTPSPPLITNVRPLRVPRWASLRQNLRASGKFPLMLTIGGETTWARITKRRFLLY